MLRDTFERKDFDVAAIYIETCDGVPDHAGAIRARKTKYELDYRCLNGEAGKIDDPTRKRFRWAPHALLVDANGYVVQTYGHVPGIEAITADVRTLLSLGMIPRTPAAAWRDFKTSSWVKLRFTGPDARVETQQFRGYRAGGILIAVTTETDKGALTRTERTVPKLPPQFRDRELERRELPNEDVEVDGRRYSCRVIERAWVRATPGGERRLLEKRWIASGDLPDLLLRHEVYDRSGAILRSRRVTEVHEERAVGEQSVRSWTVESRAIDGSRRTDTREVLSNEVPGHVVARETKVTVDGQTTTTRCRAIGFANKR